MTRCPLDGSVRVTLEQGPGYLVTKCPWCRTISREEWEEEQ